RKGYSFRAYINNYSSSADEFAATLKTFHDCLDKDWISRAVYLKSGDKITYFKNPVNYVVIAIKRLKERVLIECYNDSRNAAPECISGDCGDYFGSAHYFDEDYYQGWFINGTRSGGGSILYHSSKQTYKGSF